MNCYANIIVALRVCYRSDGTAGILPGSVLTRYDLLGTCVRERLRYTH